MVEQRYDLVIFGATGYTGQLVAEYLSTAMPANGQWALAGRDGDRLRALAERLAGSGVAPAVELADVSEPASLDALAARTRVLLTTVGPFARYGETVVRACLAGGCDYADITGEPEFVNRMRSRYGRRARELGLRLLHCCGFDSIPADLGTWYTVQALVDGLTDEEAADEEIRVEAFVRFDGRISGGTWNSAVNALGRLGRLRPAAGPADERRWIRPLRPALRHLDSLDAWACPLPTIDSQIVLDSARALPYYGLSFEYGHYAQVRHLPRLIGGAAALTGIVAVAQFEAGRRWLGSLKPPGAGPSAEERARGRFSVRLHGRSTRRRVRVQVAGGDPGYGETAKMLSETGLCLAFEREHLGPDTGFVTPAAAMGMPLKERLAAAGIEFSVLESRELSA